MKNKKSKIRIRTEEELEDRNKGLVEIRDVLEELGIAYFIWGGVLLGAIREGDFIKWDWDVEIGVYTEESYPKREKIIENLLKNGFTVKKKKRSNDNFKITATKHRNKGREATSYSITGWKKNKKFYERKLWKIPAEFLDSLDKIEFRGNTYNCPKNPKAYLEWQYGDWQTPKKTEDKKEYIHPRFSNRGILKTIGNYFYFLKRGIGKRKK